MSGYEVKITPRSERYEVETWDDEHDAWVLENFSRVSRKDAELDVEILRTLGKNSRIVGDA
jgi:hypothetical protein